MLAQSLAIATSICAGEFRSGRFVVMAITWCSPSPRKHPPKQNTEEAEAREHKEDDEDEDENVQQLEQCARLYKCLEDCLVKTDRNWRACQTEVKALKECHDAKSKDQTSSPASIHKPRPRTSH